MDFPLPIRVLTRNNSKIREQIVLKKEKRKGRLNFCAIFDYCMAHANYSRLENHNKNATHVDTGSLSIRTPSELVPT